MENKLASLRKAWALTQDELALLLNVKRGVVSRIELGADCIIIEVALKLKAVFGRSISDIFPQVETLAHEEVAAGFAEFSLRVEGAEGAVADRKRQLLSEFMSRVPEADPVL